MRGDKDMDEFVGIAIWILMGFLMVNASIMWFQSSETFIEFDRAGTAMKPSNIATTDEIANLQTRQDCSTVSNNLFQYAPCFLGNLISNVTGGLTEALGTVSASLSWFWNLLTAWVSVLSLALDNLGTIGQLMKVIFIPFFALVQIFSIIVITMKIAGIVRGGS
jgi:hypothetical protein